MSERISMLAQAIESLGLEASGANAEEEMEYGFFLRLSDSQMSELISGKFDEAMKGCSSESIIEVAMPSKIPYKGRKSRLRLVRQSNQEEYCELTTKVAKDAITKDEYNDPISFENFRSLACLGASVVARKRYKLPVVGKDNKAIYRKSGKLLQWEIDIYMDGSSKAAFDARTPHYWIKLDLEVDSPIPNVADMLPFEGEQIIPANASGTEDRQLIDGLYANGYPLTPYIGLEFWESSDAILSLIDF